MSKKNFDKKDIQNLGELSKIDLTQEEIDKFVKELDTIISSVETLNDFEEETGLEANKRCFEKIEFAELREDTVKEGLSREDALANAPYVEDGYVKIRDKKDD